MELKFHYRVYNIPPLDSILSQISSPHHQTLLFKIILIILHLHTCLQNVWLFDLNIARTSHLHYECYIPSPLHIPLFNYLNDIYYKDSVCNYLNPSDISSLVDTNILLSNLLSDTSRVFRRMWIAIPWLRIWTHPEWKKMAALITFEETCRPRSEVLIARRGV